LQVDDELEFRRLAMGVSLSTVNRPHMAYDHGGIKALKPKPNGGRGSPLGRDFA
jgi:transposase